MEELTNIMKEEKGELSDRLLKYTLCVSMTLLVIFLDMSPVSDVFI